MLLLDFLPQYHIRGFADNDPSDRYSLPSGSIRTTRHGLLESLCTDGSGLSASLVSRPLAGCLRTSGGPYSAGQRLEALQIVGEPVEQFVFMSDSPVLIDGYDNG